MKKSRRAALDFACPRASSRLNSVVDVLRLNHRSAATEQVQNEYDRRDDEQEVNKASTNTADEAQ